MQRVLLRKKPKAVRDFKHHLAIDMHQVSKLKEIVETSPSRAKFSKTSF